MVSFTRNGLKRIINIPPAKLDNEPCKESPIAKPAAPRMVIKEEVSIPNFEIKVTKSKSRIAQSKLSAKNLDKVGSTSRLIIVFLTKRLTNRIA